MQNIHDDAINFDKSKWLFFRLLSYAKPYIGLVLLALLCMIFATTLHNFRPRVLQVTIDTYLNGFTRELIETPGTIASDIRFRNVPYTYVEHIPDSELEFYEHATRYSLQQNGNDWFFYSVTDASFEPIPLTKEEYTVFRKIDKNGVSTMTIFFIVIVLGTALFNVTQEVILSITSQKIVYTIRNQLFSHIESRALSYFDKNPIGRLVTRVTNDTESLNEMYVNVLVGLATDFFAIFSVAIMMLSLNVKLALMAFIVVPFIFIFSFIFQKTIRKINRIAKSQIGKINASLNEYLTGMKIVQMFSREKKVSAHFDKLNSGYLQLNKRAVFLTAIFRPSIEILRSFVIAALIYFAAGDALRGFIPFGVFYAFTEYVGRFFMPIINLTETLDIIQDAMASSERIFTILDDTTEILNPENPKTLTDVKGKIEFRNVSFSYDGVTKVLKNISFTIQPGEFYAFVGATGAGKSSIMNLITRMYDIDEGEILIDDVNIKEFSKDYLRKIVATVQQDVFIFTGTIKDNIVLENKSITDDEVKRVCEYVNASHFIEKLPQAYNEPVMERGSTLSNGERQLLSFARTLAANPHILILDEATSSIDTEMEHLIQDALSKLLKNHTSISVAHRLSTIQHADKIIVMHKGEIIEQGKHDELLKHKGYYYNLYRLQYREDFEIE